MRSVASRHHSRRQSSSGIVYLQMFLSFVVSFIAMICPLPAAIDWLRPEFPVLTLIYWNLSQPSRAGIVTGWVAGLCMDCLTGTLFGQHALGYSIIAWFVNRLHKQVKLFSVWQQAVFVGFLLAIQAGINIWIQGILGHLTHLWWFFYPILPAMICWILVYFNLRGSSIHANK